MKKSQWKQGWAALRALGYWRTVQCYGMETADAASACFLKREEWVHTDYPFAPLAWRLADFKARRHNAQPLQG